MANWSIFAVSILFENFLLFLPKMLTSPFTSNKRDLIKFYSEILFNLLKIWQCRSTCLLMSSDEMTFFLSLLEIKAFFLFMCHSLKFSLLYNSEQRLSFQHHYHSVLRSIYRRLVGIILDVSFAFNMFGKC